MLMLQLLASVLGIAAFLKFAWEMMDGVEVAPRLNYVS
jgi:hypothetical protein